MSSGLIKKIVQFEKEIRLFSSFKVCFKMSVCFLQLWIVFRACNSLSMRLESSIFEIWFVIADCLERIELWLSCLLRLPWPRGVLEPPAILFLCVSILLCPPILPRLPELSAACVGFCCDHESSCNWRRYRFRVACSCVFSFLRTAYYL